MADHYVYMTNPSKIREFLQTIQDTGVPDKLTIQALSSLGFKSMNDRPLVRIMKAIGFISSTGEPTSRWQSYRNKQIAGTILAEGIREHYIELYKQYPNAHERDIEALRNFFSTHTKVSANTLDFMVRTFRTLCDLADFEISSSASPITEEIGGIEIGKEMMPTTVSKEKPGYTININIQLALPSDAKKETFDAFFESMKKNLID